MKQPWRGVSLALGLIFLFILIVDRPFKGQFSIDSGELAALTQKFELLDRLTESRSAPSGGLQSAR